MLNFRIALAAVAIFAAVTGVHAADLSCTCSLPGRVANGSFTSLKGSVSIVTRGGSPEVRVGTPVTVGSRVVVGPQSDATIAFTRECVVSLPPQSDLVVTGGQGGLCVAARVNGAVMPLGGFAPAGGVAGGAAGAGLAGVSAPALIAGGVVAVGAIGAVVVAGNRSGGDSARPASR